MSIKPKGHPVEMLPLGKLMGEPYHREVFTARHHACESMASYVLEGILAAVLGADDLRRWFQQTMDVLVIPLVDRDGEENENQGKRRVPYD